MIMNMEYLLSLGNMGRISNAARSTVGKGPGGRQRVYRWWAVVPWGMSDLSWVPSYYDDIAGEYDESRGGVQRARAVVRAIGSLARPPGRCLDVAGGTGIVSAELAAVGWSVSVLDRSAGMLGEAADRLPGRVLRADADRLPIRDGTVDLVTIIWMLNLLPVPTADAVLGEAARVLRPAGRLVVTVDKELSHASATTVRSDDDRRLGTVLDELGLSRAGAETFTASSPWGSARSGDPLFRLSAFSRR